MAKFLLTLSLAAFLLSACGKQTDAVTLTIINSLDVERRGDLISCRVCANGFLYNMVRAMVGTIVYAAEGKLSPADIPAILDSGNRTLAGPTVPPGGLYMTNLWYDEDVL